MSTSLETSREGRVLRLTLNRPEKRNALSMALCRAMVNALEAAQTDPSVGSILIDGKGEVFCAGMDLSEVLDPQSAEQASIHEQLFTIGAHARKPIVAAVHGPALGGGVGLLGNAHVVVAAHGSAFGLTEIRLGMWPFVIYRSIVNALGERRALELSLTGRIFHVPEAVQWGLVTEAVPAVELDDRAATIATHLAGASPQAVSAGLAFVSETRGKSAHAAGEIAGRYREFAFASEDFREGVLAFHEKRKPVWSIA